MLVSVQKSTTAADVLTASTFVDKYASTQLVKLLRMKQARIFYPDTIPFDPTNNTSCILYTLHTVLPTRLPCPSRIATPCPDPQTLSIGTLAYPFGNTPTSRLVPLKKEQKHHSKK